ncbi:MAG: RAMP superfamily CRISPR-associated protein [Microcoleaceae cyanobacterium]
MYQKGYGIIETLAPVHVGATAGEETGNLNLIFRDQFTQTGIIPGSSIRGRFRADLRMYDQNETYKWYGHDTIEGPDKPKDGGTTEAIVKFEYASLVWFPVFCPGQPIVWISCPRLLKRYQLITGIKAKIPQPYTAAKTLQGRQVGSNKMVLFFNLGFMEIEHIKEEAELKQWLPPGVDIPVSNLVVVGDNDISMLHDMGLYRQSRVKLLDDVKKAATGGFFNTEALPEGSVLIFPVAAKEKGWTDALKQDKKWVVSEKKEMKNFVQKELYFGGLESIGFGRCNVAVSQV